MKTFVLDTNVLLHDPEAMFSFGDNKVVIPMKVIEELDGFKTLNDERGRGARLISRRLDGLRSKGKLSDGITLDNGGILKIDIGHEVALPRELSMSKPDHYILGIALYYQQKGETAILITKDINLRMIEQ